MSSKDAALYGFQRPKKLRGDKEISSNTTASFASQLGSLINTSSSSSASRPKRIRNNTTKEDIFTSHNRGTAKRAKRDLEDSSAFAQKHTTNGEALDRGLWERSKRKMEEKARLYAAMKRGDVEDMDERFAVDFDKKWAEAHGEDGDEDLSELETSDEEALEVVEYTDEYGRTRTGTRADAARAARIERGKADIEGDRFTARPSAPANVIFGDTIQHQAFNPDAPVLSQMEELAKKRDRSLTPPPDLHFDSTQDVRTKGTGFFQFSGDAEERKQQMNSLAAERAETERRRREREEDNAKSDDVRDDWDEHDNRKQAKIRADEFLAGLEQELQNNDAKHDDTIQTDTMDAMQRIEAALAREQTET